MWNYRLFSDDDGYSIKECYYNDQQPYAWSETTLLSDNIAEFISTLEYMKIGCFKPVFTALTFPNQSSIGDTMQNQIFLTMDNIINLDVDIIVNAANDELRPGGGVCGVIHTNAGPTVYQECKRYLDQLGRRLNPGEAILTYAGELKQKLICHAVGPIYNPNSTNAEYLIDAYNNSLEKLTGSGYKSIAFPNISTGIYGYPKLEAAIIAIDTVITYLKSHPDLKVIFACFDDENYRIYKEILTINYGIGV